MTLNDEDYFNRIAEKRAEAIAIHFKKDFLGDTFFKAPENKRILELLDSAARGIKFIDVEKEVLENIQDLLNLRPFKRLVRFIEILDRLARHKNIKVLSSPSFLNNYQKTDNQRLNKIYEFVYNNFKKQINSKDVAELIGMNASAFSRYFKRIHRKTFTTYLNEIRIGYACKLLLENDVKITAIGYESGFSNLSNFNRQFKAITRLSPTQYIHIHTH